MNRDAVDLSLVHPHHSAIHARLSNWARWCRDGGGGSAVHPMFREYKHSYDEPVILGVPCDTLDAIAVQKSFIQLPEKHRWVLCWWYCKPYVPVTKVRKALGLTTPGLSAAIHNARTMMKNKQS